MAATLESIAQSTIFKWSWHILVALISTLAWLVFSATTSGEGYEFMLHDELVRTRGPRPPPEDIVVIALDEASYDALGLPMDRTIPRSIYAKLIRRLGELGAKRVVMDVVFAGPGASPEGDAEFAAALKTVPVVLGTDHGEYTDNGTVFHELIKPYGPFAAASHKLALVGLSLDSAMLARSMYIEKGSYLEGLPTLSEAGAGLDPNNPSDALKLPAPSDLINYYGPSRTIKTLSLYQVLEEEVPIPAVHIRNKVVYVGLVLRTALGANQKDRFATPFGDIFGVEIHATKAANLINRDWIRRPSKTNERIVGSFLVFISCFLIMLLRPIHAGISAVVLAVLWLILSYALLNATFFLTGGSGVLAAVPLAFLVNTTGSYLITLHRQKQIERAFSHYVSPQMVQQLRRNPELLKLGGQEVIATALFTDIAGFTNMSERLGAMKVTQMLNAYFSEVSDVIMDEGGTVIKFIGDAVFAVWGAPVPTIDHADRASKAALKLQRAIENFNSRGKFPRLSTRIGLNTGSMMVGNLGSNRRFDFTAIGDAVNLAARVEGVNKYLGTTLLVTENTKKECEAAAGTYVSMGKITVAGKNIPIELFSAFDPPLQPELLSQWQLALDLFQGAHWDDSRSQFVAVKESACPLSAAADTYIEAIEELRLSRNETWAGELILKEK